MRRSSRERQIVRTVISALVLLATGTFAPATGVLARSDRSATSPAPGGLSVRLVDVPVTQAGNPRALRSIVGHVRPGTTIRRRILIANHSAVAADVAVYPDAAMIRNGTFLGSAGETRSELTTWTRTSLSRLRLTPHETASVTATITVPKDASGGERYGVIFAQETSHLPIRNNLAIDEVNRVGVRIYLLVGRGGAAQTNFVIGPLTTARSAGGRPVVAAHVSDIGRRAVDLSGYLTLYRAGSGPRRLWAGPFATQLGTTLAPGQSGQVELDLGNGLPGGLWHARLILVSGLTQRRAEAIIRFGDPAVAGSRFKSGDLIIAVAAVILFALVISLARRRSRWER